MLRAYLVKFEHLKVQILGKFCTVQHSIVGKNLIIMGWSLVIEFNNRAVMAKTIQEPTSQ